ncbi:hypothetical protein [Treponema sp.]|uniref:hypothetical protein n=1 Tax=Treponema sp. TaxID=166 RepID=UPI003F08B985
MYPWSSLNRHFTEYREYDKNIDFLVIGDSLESNGMNAKIISQEFNENAFVLSPQGSYPESLYYILLDVFKKHNLKTVVIGIDVLQNFENPPYVYPHSEELYREFMQDMFTPLNLELIKLTAKNVMTQKYTSTFFKFASFPENITEIPNVMKSKKELREHKKLVKGRNYNSSVYREETTSLEPPVSERKVPKDFDKVVNQKYLDDMQDNDKKYIEKIFSFCIKNNIELYFMSNAIPESVIETVPKTLSFFDKTDEFIKNLKGGGGFYINCTDQKYFYGSTDDYKFSDCYGHYNSWYRDIHTKQVCDYIKSLRESCK